MHLALGLIKREGRRGPRRHRARARVHHATSIGASLIAPFITLLSLPGLLEHWRVRAGDMRTYPDPSFVLVAGSFALALALLCNLLLILRLLSIHPRLLTLLAVVTLSIHVLLLFLSTTIFAATNTGYVLSTAFWMSVGSYLMGLLVALLLAADWSASEGWRDGTAVSPKERSLVVAFALFLTMILLGCLSFKYLIHLTFIDALYFTVQSVLTTGFGDIVPVSLSARIFAMFYLSVGIISFAVVIAFVRSTVLESMEKRWRENESSILRGILLRGVRERGWKMGKGIWHNVTGSSGRTAVEGLEMEHASSEEVIVEDVGAESAQIEEKDYEKAILELRHERTREFRSQIFVSSLLFLAVWLIGAAVYTQLEGWSFFVAFYFCFISFSTIGYGDIAPKTSGGRAFFCVWAIIGAGVLTVFFSVLADAYSSRFKKTMRRDLFSKYLHRWQPDGYVCECRHVPESLAPHPSPPMDERPHIRTLLSDAASSSSRSKEPIEVVLVQLIDDIQGHLTALMDSNSGYSNSKEVEEGVKRIMDREKFLTSTRELVMGEEDLQRFIYLRQLKENIAGLRERANLEVLRHERRISGGSVAVEVREEPGMERGTSQGAAG